jgi:WD40 repeat protein
VSSAQVYTFLTCSRSSRVQIWRMDPTLSQQDYPFVCRSVIQTGHLANIFNAKMLPHSSNMLALHVLYVLNLTSPLRATVAGDGQVRVHQVGEIGSSGPPATATLSSRDTCINRLRCHERRVKKIATEDSPHLFLTASEDGSVRQFDLRAPHSCSDSGSCPPPLLRLNFELSALSLSPLTPFQLVVAGESAQASYFLLIFTHC